MGGPIDLVTLSRAKEGSVRRLFLSLLLISPALLFAGDLTIRIVDPDHRPIARAEVSAYCANSSVVLTTSAEGIASFTNISNDSCRIHVLAPGFAESTRSVQLPLADASPLTISLSLQHPSQTVVVSATSTPVSEAESGVSVSVIDEQTLAVTHPTDLADALRFAPGMFLRDAGQRGGLTTLTVHGGDSNYNRVMIDGVYVNEPGGQFDFGVVPVDQVQRVEVVRGSESAVYGSDAMSSVVQMWTANGTTTTPELQFGADGGNFNTAHGYASLAGAWRRFDYNLFGDQFNTDGQGPNNRYSNSLEGFNIGTQINPRVQLRLRLRHANSFSGVSGEWWFNGAAELPPNTTEFARQNNLIADLSLTVAGPGAWTHSFSGYDYRHVRFNADYSPNPIRYNDYAYDELANYNRAGFNWQSDYAPRSWARTSIGYNFIDEHGFDDSDYLPTPFTGNETYLTDGLRRNHGVFVQQMLLWKRVSLLAGVRYEHNESFGGKTVPRITATYLAWRGDDLLSGTRLRAAYSEGIVEPSFAESFGSGGDIYTQPNPNLKPEQARTLEAGFVQNFERDRLSLFAGYFNSLYRDQIEYESFLNSSGQEVAQYFNLNKSLAHGAEAVLQGRMAKHVSFTADYTYTATQILLAPDCTAATFCDTTLYGAGRPLLRVPRHLGNFTVTYAAHRWGANLSGVAVGRRPDSDFLYGEVPPVNYAAGFARFDASGYYTVNSHLTAYVNLQNLLNHYYNEIVGYPALGFNYRAGLRFTIGGND